MSTFKSSTFHQSQDADRRDESPLVELFTAEQVRQRKDWQARIEQLKTAVHITPEVQSQYESWSSAVCACLSGKLCNQIVWCQDQYRSTWTGNKARARQAMRTRSSADTYTLDLARLNHRAREVEAIGIRTVPRKICRRRRGLWLVATLC